MNDDELEILLERAAKRGAQQALKSVGLHDEEAVHDVRDLRELLDGWRGVKKTVGRTAAQVITTAILACLATGAWFKWWGDS